MIKKFLDPSLHPTRDYPKASLTKIRHGEFGGRKFVKKAGMFCIWQRSLDKEDRQQMNIKWESRVASG